MYITYDTEADALYVYLTAVADHHVAATRVVDDVRLVKYDQAGDAIGLEFLFVRDGIDLTGLPRALEVAEALRSFPRLA